MRDTRQDLVLDILLDICPRLPFFGRLLWQELPQIPGLDSRGDTSLFDGIIVFHDYFMIRL